MRKAIPMEVSESFETGVHLVRFLKLVRSRIVRKQLKERGLRPVAADELRLIDRWHPDATKHGAIVALGDPQNDGRNRFRVFYVWRNGETRGSGTIGYCGRWSPNYGFAAVKEDCPKLN